MAESPLKKLRLLVKRMGPLLNLDTTGTGTIAPYNSGNPLATRSNSKLSSVMFAYGKILSLRNPLVAGQGNAAIVVNINGTVNPAVTTTATLSKDREYGSLTVLADGKVWANGGTSIPAKDPKDPDQSQTEFDASHLDSELWNPGTGTWTTTASATEVRLYHSTALLLPDGSVITGGGGAPGPRVQDNGEIFYPPYLYDKFGNAALRPGISTISSNSVTWGQTITITGSETITRVSLVRFGAATHTFSNETRFFNYPGLTGGTTVNVTSPANAKMAPPGYYMLFAWNAAGVPSVAKIIKIG